MRHMNLTDDEIEELYTLIAKTEDSYKGFSDEDLHIRALARLSKKLLNERLPKYGLSDDNYKDLVKKAYVATPGPWLSWDRSNQSYFELSGHRRTCATAIIKELIRPWNPSRAS